MHACIAASAAVPPEDLLLLAVHLGHDRLTQGGALHPVSVGLHRPARRRRLRVPARSDICYCPMPLFHGNAIMALWAPALAVGATVALTRRFSASGFIDDVRRYGATRFTYVGTALAYVLATGAAPDDADNPLLSRIRHRSISARPGHLRTPLRLPLGRGLRIE